MRAKTLFALLILGCSALIVVPAITTGQQGGFGKKKGGGGGGFMMTQDPGALFDIIAKGRPFFLISETRTLRDPLTQYAKEKGIANGQISRQQFIEFQEQSKTKLMSGGASGANPPSGFGGFGGKGKKGDMGAPPSGIQVTPGMPLNVDAINQWADADFKNRDANGDGKLNQDEMPGPLRGNLSKWDKNGDGLIDLLEYREYFAARLSPQGDQDRGTKGVASIIIEEEELDRKPVVFRAGGKMPANLPAWFKELDTDGDGQVALYEWRRGGKDLDDFKLWDLNDDGFITPEEAIKQQAVFAKSNPGSGTSGSLAASTTSGDDRTQFGKGKAGKTAGDFKGFGKGGKGKKTDRQP